MTVRSVEHTLYALAVVTLLVMLSILSGCASTGITMSADEEAACKAEGCTVWTEGELRMLIQQVYKDAYMRGGKAAI